MKSAEHSAQVGERNEIDGAFQTGMSVPLEKQVRCRFWLSFSP
jgi:hypothetical protein